MTQVAAHPQDAVVKYACGEIVGDPIPLLKHLSRCELCHETMSFVRGFIRTLREEGRVARRQGRERPTIESLLQKMGQDDPNAREILVRHFGV